MSVPIGISNRHIHLSSKDADILFGTGYEFKKLKDLSQPGQYACLETVTIRGPKGKFENVRQLGPFRSKTQVEIMLGDCYVLGVDAPIRLSGDLEDTPGLEIIGPKGSIKLDSGVIVAQRHIHSDPESAKRLGIENGQNVKLKVGGPRGIVFENVAVRVSDKFNLDCHLDIEEGNAAGIKGLITGEIVS